MKEKRSTERRETYEYWTVTETATGRRIGVVIDLTREGLRLHCEEIIPSGKLIQVTVHIDKKIAGTDKIDLELRCRWCRKTRVSHLNAVGFAIVSPSPDYLKIEQKLIDFFSTVV
ncbi:MAG: PilZ domain-containing protein [bacterium]